MKAMSALSTRLHARLGDFWWYSILMFVALRIGDVINAFVGLWLVPKYVDASELGAVLPLTQFATTLGIPLAILVTVFTKFLTHLQTKGEKGKVKSLLLWFIGLSLIGTLLTTIIAITIMPHLFTRIRVVEGSLGVLIIVSGVVGTISPVFNTALQGLKKFRTITLLNILSAPIRLGVMLITLPIRALSGYMAGQIAAPVFAIATTCFALRKHVNSDVKSEPFWRNGLGKEILKFTLFVAISSIPSAISMMVQTTIIRQRFPEIESAAYYMISRFAELATYAGGTLMFIMFPLAAEACANGREDKTLLKKLHLGTVIFGCFMILLLYLFGSTILNALPTTRPYVVYSDDMVILAFALLLQFAWGNHSGFETANGRFSYLYYSVPLTIFQIVILTSFCGYTFFYGILPKGVVDWMGSCHLSTLRNYLWFTVGINAIRLVFAYIERLIRILKANRFNNSVN